MFKLYLFFSDIRDIYNYHTDDNDSVNIVDMAERVWKSYSREQLLMLRDACLSMAKRIEAYVINYK